MPEERETPKEQERRAWVERQELFRDQNEEYERASAVASTKEERQTLAADFSAYRTKHRQEDVMLGKRAPGIAVTLRQVMWVRWMEVAVQHELEAKLAYQDILRTPNGDSLLNEFRASLVAVTASAYAIEGVYGEIKYFIPPQRRQDRDKRLASAFGMAFGLSAQDAEWSSDELRWLFGLRDSAVHPYTESEVPAAHPAGVNTGIEHSRFNAYTSQRAVNLSMTVLAFAARPPAPLSRWVERWADDRAPHHDRVDSLRVDRNGIALPELPSPPP
jgi:hypothetical protein